MYRIPKDIVAFDEHYFGTHVALAQMLPGLRKVEILQGPHAMPFGASDFHLMATYHFDNMDAADRAFATPEGRAEEADRRILAPDDGDVITLLVDGYEYTESGYIES